MGASTLYMALLLLLGTLSSAAGQTMPSDKEALLGFKASVIDNGLVLASWTNDTDPCIDQWTGISCTCYPFFEESGAPKRVPSCTPLDWTGDGSRVLQINFGDLRINDWNFLGGNLPAWLGNLTALRVLNLKNNNFTGEIPSQWSKLTNLEQLILAGNNITGMLPVFLNNFPRLKYVYLNDNNFTGDLPIDWCLGSWWMFDVSDNPGICDEVPGCLMERLVSFKGTSLVDPVSDDDGGMGGYCGVAPPTCRVEQDSCWVQVPDPAWWTDPSKVSFSFPDFPSTEGGTAPQYTWRLGTTPGAGDVIDWTPFEGKNVTQSAEVMEPGDNKGTVISQVVNIANGTLPNGIGLQQGETYYVSVRGANAGGVLNGLIVTSDPVTVDYTPPVLPAGSAVYSGQYLANIPAQTNTNGIGVSWDSFEDDESGVQQYAYQVFEYNTAHADGQQPDYVGDSQTSKVNLKDVTTRDVYITKLDLEPGKSYFVRVYVENGAGLETYVDAPPVAIVLPGEGIVVANNTVGLTVSKVVIIVAALVGATCAAVAVITFYLARERYRKRQQASRKYRGQLRNLRHMLNSLTERVGDPEKGQLEDLRHMKNMVFVITDLENSTSIASSAPRAFEWVQEAHDTLMRDLIAAHGGYEINTEGDAFHVAFKDVARAVHFCMEVQYQMMELEWPKEVLRLPECREVRSPDGGLSYRGPRVRMGVHWATEGSVVQSIHALTKHKIFSGPAFQVTRELCESAVGGQVLLTHDVWQRLRAEMPAASFPVVEQLGCYKFSSWTESIWVYQVTRLLGRPLHRPPIPNPKLAGADAIVPGAGLSIMPVPVPRTSRGDLAFVSCRFAVEDCPASASGAPLPAAVQSRLFEGLAAAAMQFEGYIFRMSESQGCYLLAFASPIDAVRFCHAAQVLLMYIPWTPEMAEWCGAEEGGPDGKLVFNGPRVAMAVHESNDYSTRPVPMAVPTADGAATLTDYLGPAEEAVRALSEVAHGGQVVLSEAAWRAVQDQLPGSPQVISLGSHILEETCFTGPAMLMEVMPQPLSKRSFPPPRRARMVDPGYRDAPSARFDVAIAQMRVVKPAVVAAAESAANNLSDDAIIRVVTAYNVALARAVRAARTLLRAHNGYECKEPEPGKLTVAFTSLEAAVRWGAHLQRALLDIHWPKEVLSWDECREVRDGEGEGDGDDLDLDLVYGEDFKEGLVSIGGVVTTFQPHKAASSAGASGRGGILGGIDGAGGEVASVTASGFGESSLLWRGLRVRIGIACGVPTSKAPLNTGRADYFGTIPNLAARLMSIAQPGQVIFDAAKLPTLKSLQWRDDTGVMPGNEAFAEGLEVTALGQFAIKGLEELRSVFQALPVGLQGRAFEESPALVRPVGLSLSRRIASLRRPSEPLAAGIVGVPPAEGPLAAGANGAGPTAPGAGSTPSASAFASPKAWRPGGIFSSISRSGSATLGNRRGPAGSATALLARSVSRLSDSSDGTGALRPPVVLRASALSASETSTNSWLARSMAAAGTRIGVRSGPGRDSFGDPAQDSSAASSPKSPSATSFSGIPIPTGNALGGAKARGSRLSNADLDPEGGGASSAPAGTGFVGPEMSPEGGSLAAAASMAPSGPYTTLGDVADWSYPASRSHTPCAVSKVVDHWDAGLAMEAALKSDGLDLAQQRRRDMDAQVESSSPAGSLMLEAAERGQEGSQGDWRHPKRGLKVQTQSAERGVGEGDGSGGHGASTGLQYARQIAQLFVDRKRKSLERSTAGKETVPGASPTKSSWLSGRLRPSGSKEATPGTTPTKGLLGGLKGRRGAFSDQVDP